MHDTLGEKIGDGVFAEVHAWAPGQAVKLSKPGLNMGLLTFGLNVTLDGCKRTTSVAKRDEP